jgi:hypothetical protein
MVGRRAEETAKDGEIHEIRDARAIASFSFGDNPPIANVSPSWTTALVSASRVVNEGDPVAPKFGEPTSLTSCLT